MCGQIHLTMQFEGVSILTHTLMALLGVAAGSLFGKQEHWQRRLLVIFNSMPTPVRAGGEEWSASSKFGAVPGISKLNAVFLIGFAGVRRLLARELALWPHEDTALFFVTTIIIPTCFCG